MSNICCGIIKISCSFFLIVGIILGIILGIYKYDEKNDLSAHLTQTDCVYTCECNDDIGCNVTYLSINKQICNIDDIKFGKGQNTFCDKTSSINNVVCYVVKHKHKSICESTIYNDSFKRNNDTIMFVIIMVCVVLFCILCFILSYLTHTIIVCYEDINKKYNENNTYQILESVIYSDFE